MKYVAIVLFMTVAICPAHAAGKGPAFSELAAGESMTVLYHSQGCFHNQRHFFVFERVVEGVRASLWNTSPRGESGQKEEMQAGGSAILTDAQLTALDRTLAFYRGAPGGGCTTEDAVHFTWKRAGTADEKYTDSSCSIDAKKDLLTFHALAAHIATAHAARGKDAK